MKKNQVIAICLLMLGLLPMQAFATVACDGVDDVLTFSGVTLGSTFTIAGWIVPTPAPTFGSILVNANTNQGLWYTAFSDLTLLFATSAGSVFMSTPLTSNVWNHIALVSTSGTAQFYLNGVTSPTNGSIAAGFLANRVCNDDPGEVLTGRIGALQIYPAALNANEIATLAANRTHGLGISQARSVAWTLDQCADGANGNGTAFADRSGNGQALTADDGPNNTGMTCSGEFNYVWGAY